MTFSGRVVDLWSLHDIQCYIYEGSSWKATWIYNQHESVFHFTMWFNTFCRGTYQGNYCLSKTCWSAKLYVYMRYNDCALWWVLLNYEIISQLWQLFPSFFFFLFQPWFMQGTEFLIIYELSPMLWDLKHPSTKVVISEWVKLLSSKPSLCTSLDALWEIRHTNRDITSFKSIFISITWMKLLWTF